MNLENKKGELPLSVEVESHQKEWHRLSNEKILKILKTDQHKGLTQNEADKRLEEFGRNTLPQPKKPNIVLIFLKSFLDPLSIMLVIAGLASLVVSLVSGEITPPDIAGITIIAVIVLSNSFIATVQEWKSLNQVASLGDKKRIAVVLRDGNKKEIDIEELVPGDIIFIKSGDFVPGDTRIVDNQMLKIDESALTGENESVDKISEIIKEKNLVLGDQKNIAFMSTLVVEGKMMGVVFGTGPNSEIGKIATKITDTKKETTPLERKVVKLTVVIGLISVILGLILFGVTLLIKNNLDWATNPEQFESYSKLILIAVSSAISVIPESLTIIVKICLMVATKKMARKNVLIKNPKSIETLGNVNVICSDKTGTLTQNKMHVDSLFMNMKSSNIEELDFSKSEYVTNCLALCSDALIHKDEKIGSATELALIEMLKKYDIKYLNLRKTHKRIDEIPFDSKRKMMTTVCQVDDKKIVYTKGAVDYLVKSCKFKNIDGKVSELTSTDVETIKNQMYEYAKKGMRTIGFSYKELINDDDLYEQDLIFLGVAAIIDPPREEVIHSIKEAHSAGIRVIMITGDHKITAFEIASRLGISNEYYKDVITGQDIEELSYEDLKEKLKTTNVFARVNPEHKALIVTALQEDNNIVAMTGDGVNDSPSLVKADVGIAMGITGTEVSKEVSDVILSDDNFKSIIAGVNSGRNVYEKIKYSISFLIAANLSQVLTLLLILAIHQSLALNSVNILFHIFVVETIVAIPIGMQRERKGVMLNQPPKHKRETLLKGIVIQMIITTTFNTLFAVLNYQISIWYLPGDLELAENYGKTGVYVAVMFSPIFYAILYNNFFLPINSDGQNQVVVDRYKPNRWLLILMAVALTLSVLTMLPFEKLNEFFDFKTQGMPPLLMVIFFASALMVPWSIWATYKLLLISTKCKKATKVASL
ncbi:P-type Ca2+ transporter type 2C [Spiroplasma chinense]|uniref:P-type Ca2+ transporter type 2C n=1 Tax=Spiroplasma chinense TaxID=216932 RepID=A0A5B9Y2V0_9MOLU|nr:cation-translocating P-type ATPase [Spiroplasma chinense]QEH61378.1 P-type Ca2+ transporter type 2C [Spiroplasma chinense]